MYNFKEIEKKWQIFWEENRVFHAKNDSEKPKYYALIEFPYPSGTGLHVGHVRSYTALDAMSRMKRLQGYNVLFPMGWDAFGLPAEGYAIKNHIHPKEAVKENIKTFKGQLQNLGLSFDWSREFATTDPEYYKWTQWQFLKFYEHGLAYKAKKAINWCPNCKIGLANEEIEAGHCERCGGEVIQKEKEQWMLGMRSYAEELLEGLDDTNFLDKIKNAQINWIGKSKGALVDFSIFENSKQSLRVFTTRPDTLYGVTFMVIAPEHPLIKENQEKIKNMDEIRSYQEQTKRKNEMERGDLNKDKTGVKLDGLTAVNPITKENIPIFTADYVMMGYGTGAIMAVPAHDDRDYDFAMKFNLPIKRVIEGGELPYTGEGALVNSGFLNGISKKSDAIDKMVKYLEENHLGKQETTYRLQDWVFSRQRFWGEPIPMIYCDDCGWVPVPYENLPVVLPDVAEYEPTDNGESPLAKIKSWWEVDCPKCGKKARRETDTMPNWAGSSWYYLRYMDASNDKEFASMDALKYWGKVDWYNGGMEHATRHLLYARFWHRFLYNIGLVPFKEPFDVRVAHGMVLGENGEKMSKSKGNVVNPNAIVEEYGADTLRTYEMFMGDYEKEVAWSENGLKGSRRFIERVWKLQEMVTAEEEYSKELENLIHRTIKKVSDDFLHLKYNTVVSSLMILVNEFEKIGKISRKDYRTFLTLLYPIAPHITEELNEVCKLGKPLCMSPWPKFDEDKLTDEEFEVAVQVNGKLRGTIMVKKDDDEEVMKEKAINQENVKKHIADKEIAKVIVIKGKIVNIVVK